MNWKRLVAGAAVGFAAAVIAKEILNTSRTLSPEYVLKDVKERVKKRGHITGSWISMTPETYEKNESSYNVYRGGITQQIDDTYEQFDFVADAKTGEIVELQLQPSS